MNNYRTQTNDSTNIYRTLSTPRTLEESNPHVILFSDDIRESYLSDDSIADDDELNEFINDSDFNIPMLDENNQRSFRTIEIPHNNTYINQIDMESAISPKYFLLDFVLCISTSIVFYSINFTVNLIDNESIFLMYMIRIVLQNIFIGILINIFTTSTTYKTINYSLDIIPINWVLYSYPIPTVFRYLAIQLSAITIGAYISIGMYYNKLLILDKKILLQSIISNNNQNEITVDSFILILIVHSILIIGSSIIMSNINSINCGQKYLYIISYISLISLIYEIIIGPIIFITYKSILYLAILSVYSDAYQYANSLVFIIIGINIFIKMIIYPLATYHIKYIWSKFITRYIEYV